MFHERLSRRSLLKATGGLLLMSVAEVRMPGQARAAMTRTRWTEQGGFPDSGAYESQVFSTEGTFNSIELIWRADAPAGSVLDFRVRSSADGVGWTDWMPMHQDSHVRSLEDARTFATPLLVAPSRHVQYRVEIGPGASGEAVGLREVEIGCVDTSPVAQFAAETNTLLDGWIISRAGWGADESLRYADGKEKWTPRYRPIEKVIIHHTVTQNNPPDPAASVRAIYYYHAITQGWGDIGYNFLVDWQGNVYEGRFGGPEVVGGHALQYNRGSLGIAVLGEFGSSQVPQPALDAIVRLIKSRAGHVDPAGIGFFVDRANVPNYCGHGDLLETECPGTHLSGQIPVIRGLVKGTGPIYLDTALKPSSAALTGFQVRPTSVYAGSPLRIDAVVRNTGGNRIFTQGPSPGFHYIEGEDFVSAGFDKIEGAYRVGVDFRGNGGLPNPYRWGFNTSVEPGAETTVTGLLTLNSVGTWTLSGSVVEEFVQYHTQNAFPTTITVLPPPTEPAPENQNDAFRFVDVTQHNVPDVFDRYWEANGGLARFGYPLTEPFYEVSETDYRIYLTQYFERARFEQHPDFAGTEYEVLLGLLGRERTTHRMDEAPFRPLPALSSTAEFDYYPETGHTLRAGFRDYWRNNGGLASFGYPISEEFEEISQTDGQMHVVQYFERVRIEWHPQYRGTEYEFLLGHLAREILIDRGWL